MTTENSTPWPRTKKQEKTEELPQKKKTEPQGLPNNFSKALKAALNKTSCDNTLRHTFALFGEFNIHAREMEPLRQEGCHCDCDVLRILEDKIKSSKKVAAEKAI